MIQAALWSAIAAVWRYRPFGACLVGLACAGCASPQAKWPVASSDVSCVRSVEAAGGSFPQAAAHCEKNPFNTLYPTMLDLSGAPDLQKQAFASGYYDRDLPASATAEAARLQSLQSGLTASMAVRAKSQGKMVKPLSAPECTTDLLDVPHEAFALGPRWDGGGPSLTNPYLTPQENDCLAQQRDAASSPADQPRPAVPSPVFAAPLENPLAKAGANDASKESKAHIANPSDDRKYKVLIM